MVFSYLFVFFIPEIRTKTSGAAFPQLVFSHWSMNVQDPLYVPPDEVGIIVNVARKIMESTRKRKGLFVEEKLVQSGTKQRTLSKKA